MVVKDDLQVIKGVGPFIEEKLNALGITTYRQIANMNAKLEKQVNEAIEFFPGRVARDQWVAQAKILLGENVKLDEKALKQAEELERVAKKAEKIDFKTIGVASASDRDNLQELKGIGPFIEEKLNALGIFKFEQIARMTSKIEDEVNIAIEFFPGRVKRDQWVAQAKIKIGEDVKLDEKALKKAEELERVAKKAEKIDFGTIGVASASDKDNLQELKGIGPFIEEKLNALGIFKFEQIAKMTSKIEDEVSIYGDDSYAGTSTCPMKTLSGAVDDAVANDEIIMQSGLYHDNVSIDGIDNLEIRAATGATVIFDGTRSITEDLGGVWGSADSDGIQEVTLTQDGWQLFLAHEEQVPARWPNAKFSDDTVFNRSYMAEGTLTNSNNAYTVGWLTDAGPEAGVHTGLNETINATGLDPVGAIAVMNLGSFRSNSREITGWNASNGTFSYDGTGVGWKSKHHAYFLEGKRELIDVDGEWWYNNTDNTLHYKTPTSQDANDLDLRVKVQPFAISVDNSDGVTIQGIDFFGTTVNFNNCDGCSFTNSTLQYPSTSKRGLGIAGESEDDRWMTRFYRCKNTFVDKISITNTDGGALEFHGSGGQSHNNTVNNSYFHAIDWSAADQKGLMTTIYEGGRDMYFTNNSVHLTGASSVLSIGDAPKVFYNRVWDVGHLQTDGAVVQVMQGEAPGAEIAYNWIHDVIKYGARFDAPINEVGEGMNGTMHHNVIWNAAGGLMVKGDYHDIHNNTVFNSTGKNDIIFLTDGGINNKNSTLHYNAVDAMADHRSDDIFANPIPYGADWMNWNGYIQGKQDAVTTLHDEINSNTDLATHASSTAQNRCFVGATTLTVVSALATPRTNLRPLQSPSPTVEQWKS